MSPYVRMQITAIHNRRQCGIKASKIIHLRCNNQLWYNIYKIFMYSFLNFCSVKTEKANSLYLYNKYALIFLHFFMFSSHQLPHSPPSTSDLFATAICSCLKIVSLVNFAEISAAQRTQEWTWWWTGSGQNGKSH